MAQSRISIAKSDIVKLFDEYQVRVFDFAMLQGILEKNRKIWRLAQSMSTASFIEYLIKKSKLKEETLEFSYRPITKYTWGTVPLYELLMALKPQCYLSHYTAVYLHQLTEQTPTTIYINWEQKPKPWAKTDLSQPGIDRAFAAPTRLSSNMADFRNIRLRMLNGMNTGNLGVIEINGPEGELIRTTDIERTLIDIAVRPEYAGGPAEVLTAYRSASHKVSVNRVAALLEKINYTYPYHQVIGFYLEAAGTYTQSQVRLLQRFKIEFDFYLMHKMGECDYSTTWKLYYPKGFGQ